MKINLSNLGNFVFGRTICNETEANEYIKMLFDKYGEDFFQDVYNNFINGESECDAFKKALGAHGKLTKLHIRTLTIKNKFSDC